MNATLSITTGTVTTKRINNDTVVVITDERVRRLLEEILMELRAQNAEAER